MKKETFIKILDLSQLKRFFEVLTFKNLKIEENSLNIALGNWKFKLLKLNCWVFLNYEQKLFGKKSLLHLLYVISHLKKPQNYNNGQF